MFLNQIELNCSPFKGWTRINLPAIPTVFICLVVEKHRITFLKVVPDFSQKYSVICAQCCRTLKRLQVMFSNGVFKTDWTSLKVSCLNKKQSLYRVLFLFHMRLLINVFFFYKGNFRSSLFIYLWVKLKSIGSNIVHIRFI